MGVVVEYHLPYSGQRIDVVFLGESGGGRPQAVVVELKQWSEVEVEDEFALNVVVGGKEHQHPSQQALDYAGALEEVHSSFVEGRLFGSACSYCHNLPAGRERALVGPQFRSLLADSPLFKKGEGSLLADHLIRQAGKGQGAALMREYGSGRFRPSKKVIDLLEATIREDEQWHLLGSQREAYNAIFAQVARLKTRKKKSAVLVRGGPGTGKTVIAVQLLADALRLGLSAAHSTGGKAFTTALRSKFKGADRLFIWNLNTRNVPTQALDLLLVDEAHRVRKTSDTRWTKGPDRNGRSQTQELLDAAKVTVFLLDENQFVRPDEIGCSDLVRRVTAERGIPLKEFDLDTQFRCGGCVEYATWVDYLLDFSPAKPRPWGRQYRLTLVDSPTDLDAMLRKARQEGERARVVAGFCWKWSDPDPDGTLPEDVRIGSWAMPWNAKRNSRRNYKPQDDPYTLWADTEAGEQQVGCIYSAQGFEFDRVGVIWGPDLVWRDGAWAAQPKASYDRPVKAATADTLRLVRNAYRVLLTRGMRQTHLYCVDEETRKHVAQELEGMQAVTPGAELVRDERP
jgi:hypothetical protein